MSHMFLFQMNKDPLSVKFLQWSLSLFLFMLPLQAILILRQPVIHGAVWQYGVIGWYAIEAVLWASLILWVFCYWRQAKDRIRMPWQWSRDRMFAFSLLVFVLFSYASAWWWAYDFDLAFQHARWLLEAVLIGLAVSFGSVNTKKLAGSFIVGGVAAAFLGIWQFLFQDTFASTLFGLSAHPIAEPGTSVVAGNEIGRWLRAYGPFSHPNVFGGYSAIAAIVCLFLLGTSKIDHRKSGIFFIVLAVLTAGVFFSFSRSAWVAWAIGMLVYWIIVFTVDTRERALRLGFSFAAMIVFLILSVLYAPLVQTRLFRGSPTEVWSIDDRFGQYEQATILFKEHPWFGVGIGNYTAALLSRDPSLPGWAYQPVHHVFFLILVEVGVVGLVLLFLVCISGFLLFMFMDAARRTFFLLCLPFMPLLFFDHYLWTGFSGMMLGAVSVPLLARIFLQHMFSTVHQPVIPEWPK